MKCLIRRVHLKYAKGALSTASPQRTLRFSPYARPSSSPPSTYTSFLKNPKIPLPKP